MARLLLVLIVNGNEFHKTGAARAKARSPSVEQLAFGTNRRDFADERRAYKRSIKLPWGESCLGYPRPYNWGLSTIRLNSR